MAETTRYHRIAPANLQRAIMLVFKQAGSSEREQKLTADHLVAANLTGHDSHGVGMIPAYLQAMRDKKLTINGKHTVAVDAGPILTVDGGLGLGQVIAYDAMNLGMERAKQMGVCILGIRNAHHTGRIGHWSEQCAAAGFVSMHYVAGFAGVTSVAPFGGRETRFQTNPYSAGFPLPGRAPIILDFATSKIAMGKVRVALNKGEQVPENCLIDADGQPTRDPAVMYAPPGKRGALFRGDVSDPLLIEVNTSTEYWQKGASLLHTDPLGKSDVKLPANARVYMVAGTQHGGRAGLSTAPGQCANPRNPHSPAPALRALIVALDEWVSTGKAPPASQVPTLATRTLVAPDATGFPELPGAQVARFGNKLELFGDWKNPQPDTAKAYTTLVSKVDPDGNELAGIRLPDIAVPLATHTGWNMYKAPFTEGELCDRDGSYFAFAKTRAERATSGDPRPALEERYAGQADYVNKVIKAASALVKARLLLQEDAEAYAQAATRRRIFD